MTGYGEFIQSKARRFTPSGFTPDTSIIPIGLFPWQKQVVKWAVEKGRAAIWADTGLGKTAMQLAWAEQVAQRTGKPVLILTPLAVSYQTQKEAVKFGLTAQIIDGSTPVSRLSITNYQKLHRLNPSMYSGVVLDESSILKSFMGATKRKLVEAFADTPYRLACTATPAPNDHLELLNHAEFLGIMRSNEILSRWFINDSMEAGNYRLKQHAKKDFWQWVASWAMVIRRPSDLGFSDEGYNLPPLSILYDSVTSDEVSIPGALFADAAMSATNLHTIMRQTALHRVQRAAELVMGQPKDSWLLWTHTNYEADAVHSTNLEIQEVRGSDTDEHKERMLLGFAEGEVPRLMSKPSLAGFGMNWQHCHSIIFVGMNYSYEQFYQAIRRCWRFGQREPVTVHCLTTDMEWQLIDTIAKKQQAHRDLQDEMVALMKGNYCA